MKFLVLLCFGFFVLPTQANFLTSDLIKTDKYNINVIMARANMYVADTEKYIRDENLRKAKEDLKFAKSIIANKKTSLTIANLEKAKRNLSFAQKEYKIAINTFNKRKSIFHKEMKRVIGIKPTNSQGWPSAN